MQIGSKEEGRVHSFWHLIGFSVPLGAILIFFVGWIDGLILGLSGAAMILLTQMLGAPAPTASATTPRNLLRADRAVALVGALLSVVLGVSLFTGISSGTPVKFSLYELFITLIPILLTTLLLDPAGRSAWGIFLLVRAWHAVRCKTPWRLCKFLEDAHHLGVLRQVGGSYEFRHSRLQDSLAKM